MTVYVRRKPKYTFDINEGHYKAIFEDGEQGNEQAQDGDSEQQSTVVLPQLQTQDVVQVQNQEQQELKKFDDEIAKYKTTQEQLQSVIAQNTTEFNQAQNANKEQLRTNIIQNNAKLLQVMQDIATKTKDKALKQYEYESKILKMQLDLNESKVRRLPEKYRSLNESNIHKAKIYMGDLVQNDDNHILKDMTDFKHTFADSELLYGKDKEGYFVICIDQDDFQKMYNTLEETGYLKDDIIATVMPQVFDRNVMTK